MNRLEHKRKLGKKKTRLAEESVNYAKQRVELAKWQVRFNLFACIIGVVTLMVVVFK